MAQHVQHQFSGAPPYDSSHPGCMWGLLHFLDLQQRLGIRKMLAHRKHHDGKHPGRIKAPKAKRDLSLIGIGHDCLDRGESIPVKGKIDNKSGSSTKARMRNLLPRRRSRDQDQMPQISPIASRLMRTISIHHSETHDYVLPDVSDGEVSTAEVNSNDTDSSASIEHVPLLHKPPDRPIQCKRCEMCGAMNTMDHLDERGKHFLEKQLLMKEKLTEAKEALLKQKATNGREIGDGTFHQSKEFLDMMELFSANRELFLKIAQDPRFMLANYLRGGDQQASSSVMTKSGSFPIAGPTGRKYDESFAGQGCRVGESRASSSFGFLPSSPLRMKNQKSSGTVSNRFKAIKQRIKNVIKENREEHRRVSMDGILHKVPYGHKVSENVNKESQVENVSCSIKYAHKSMRRSHSLNESLDKYSRLLESISSGGSKKPTERSLLLPEKPPKSLRRIFSLPELEMHFENKDFQGYASVNSYGFDNPKSEDILVNMDENMGLKPVLEQNIEVDTNGDIFGGPVLADGSVPDDQATEDGSCVPLSEHEIGNGIDPSSDQPTEQCPTSIYNSCFQQNSEHELDPQSQLVIDASNAVECSETDFVSPFHVQVDQKDTAEFNYVREILWKSGFIGEEFLGSWYSPYQPMDPLLFEEAEGSPHETGITGDETVLYLDHQLLFDLINEVLLEIYGASFVYCPWLSRFDSRIRPMPVGRHVLEEVWANISWCLCSSAQFDQTIECVVARDYTKNDGWLNLQIDSEDVALELEDMIFHDLLDDVVLQLCHSSDVMCVL